MFQLFFVLFCSWFSFHCMNKFENFDLKMYLKIRPTIKRYNIKLHQQSTRKQRSKFKRHPSIRSVTCPGNCTLDLKPPTMAICNIRPCSDWTVGTWSECDVLCGEGIQVCQVLGDPDTHTYILYT